MNFSRIGFISRSRADRDPLDKLHAHFAGEFPNVDILLDSPYKFLYVCFVFYRSG